MDKPATTARYSLLHAITRPVTGVALLVLVSQSACVPAKPPTVLAGPSLTNADDRALARLTEVAWAALDELDPIARDEAGASGDVFAWPATTPGQRAKRAARLQPIQQRLARIRPAALSPLWQAAYILLNRRLQFEAPPWDVYSLQQAVDRGLWAALGPTAWPSAQRLDRLDALGYFLSSARTVTVATSRERLQATIELLDAHRTWISQMKPPQPGSGFAAQRDLAVVALEMHDLHVQDNLLSSSSTVGPPAHRPWRGRWTSVPPTSEIEVAATRALDRVQSALLALAQETSGPSSPLERAERLDAVVLPTEASGDLGTFLASLKEFVAPFCPPPPPIDAATAPPALHGIAAVRLDSVRARTSTESYRLWLSTDGPERVRQMYPPAHQMALALYEGWPGRALYHWAISTRLDRGVTERRWADPVFRQGWPLFALDRLLRPERLPSAVRRHVLQILLRTIVDAQVDLWAQRDIPPDDAELRRWLTDVGRQSPAEAQRKLTVARTTPGRLTVPFLGWWTLTQLADIHLPEPSSSSIRRFAACTEWPPDLLPTCLSATVPAPADRQNAHVLDEHPSRPGLAQTQGPARW